ncbi:hypothetical protein EYF80_016421 [Liparis tanakae]|uniref:Uncharacterized protein n=1 Tax=Liparis tanakae TaxID=230148 RepID=A0A4Z2I5L6_9TELE|nr:hypothetical protein EYF80_016421 [Liparis tanakae]
MRRWHTHTAPGKDYRVTQHTHASDRSLAYLQSPLQRGTLFGLRWHARFHLVCVQRVLILTVRDVGSPVGFVTSRTASLTAELREMQGTVLLGVGAYCGYPNTPRGLGNESGSEGRREGGVSTRNSPGEVDAQEEELDCVTSWARMRVKRHDVR